MSQFTLSLISLVLCGVLILVMSLALLFMGLRLKKLEKSFSALLGLLHKHGIKVWKGGPSD